MRDSIQHNETGVIEGRDVADRQRLQNWRREDNVMTNLEELRVKPELAREVERLARELEAAGTRQREASEAYRAVYTEYEKARDALVEHILSSLGLKILPYDVLARLRGPDDCPF